MFSDKFKACYSKFSAGDSALLKYSIHDIYLYILVLNPLFE